MRMLGRFGTWTKPWQRVTRWRKRYEAREVAAQIDEDVYWWVHRR